jgi:thiol-disulfide isomerase/thioredoxin
MGVARLPLRWSAVLLLSLLLPGASAPLRRPFLPPAHFFELTPPVRVLLRSRPVLGAATLSEGALTGRVVLVTFFASWCLPCREELHALAGVYRRHRARGLEVVAVNHFEDFAGDSNPGRLAAFLERMALPFPVIQGSDGLVQVFGGVPHIPTLLMFDRHGRQRYRFPGTGPAQAVHPSRLEALVRSLL